MSHSDDTTKQDLIISPAGDPSLTPTDTDRQIAAGQLANEYAVAGATYPAKPTTPANGRRAT